MNDKNIDYKFCHDNACELFKYIENFLKPEDPKWPNREQICYEIERAMQLVAFNEWEVKK